MQRWIAAILGVFNAANGLAMLAGDGGMFAVGALPFIRAADFGGVLFRQTCDHIVTHGDLAPARGFHPLQHVQSDCGAEDVEVQLADGRHRRAEGIQPRSHLVKNRTHIRMICRGYGGDEATRVVCG